MAELWARDVFAAQDIWIIPALRSSIRRTSVFITRALTRVRRMGAIMVRDLVSILRGF